ncbi:MAG: hypothetical protein JJ895_04540 [Balneolaceae bacterium]|nr:hypothetical protein [Balneolaceae bacterium]
MVKYLVLISFIVVAILLPSFLKAQPLFEKGYYIDLNDVKHSGFIDRSFLDEIPNDIRFKRTRRDSTIELSPFAVKKIEVSGLQLVPHIVEIDTSVNHVNEIKEPSFENRHLFLELIVEGGISLFKYKTETHSYFFIKTGSSDTLTPLIYKQYRGERGLYNNNNYREQLDSIDDCFSYSKTIDDVKYNEQSLMLFIEYLNTCINFAYNRIPGSSNHSLRYLNISAFTGIRWNKMTSTESVTSENIFTWKDFGFTNVGIEFEYLIAPYRNRIASILRFDFARSYDSSIINMPLGNQFVEKNIDYLYLTFGFRGYLNTNSAFKLYADAGIAKPLAIQDGISLKYERSPNFVYENENLIPTFGLGITTLNRFSLESKVEFIDRTISSYDEYNTIKFTAFTVNLKYAFKSYYSFWEK